VVSVLPGATFPITDQLTETGFELKVLSRTVKVPGKAAVSAWAGA